MNKQQLNTFYPNDSVFLWVDPNICEPPHRITHFDKFDELKESLSSGWDINCPVLLGYIFNHKIQLISGSHRWAVMMELKSLDKEIQIPILLMSYQYVYSLVGKNEWIDMVKNPPLLSEFIYD